MSATEFKIHCLDLLDRVQETGQVLRITKRGKVVAELHPQPTRHRVFQRALASWPPPAKFTETSSPQSTMSPGRTLEIASSATHPRQMLPKSTPTLWPKNLELLIPSQAQ